MGKEDEEVEGEEALEAEDVLLALAIQARENPTTINAETIEHSLKEAGLEEIWEAAGEEEGEEDDEELDDENDEDGEESEDEA